MLSVVVVLHGRQYEEVPTYQTLTEAHLLTSYAECLLVA